GCQFAHCGSVRALVERGRRRVVHRWTGNHPRLGSARRERRSIARSRRAGSEATVASPVTARFRAGCGDRRDDPRRLLRSILLLTSHLYRRRDGTALARAHAPRWPTLSATRDTPGIFQHG